MPEKSIWANDIVLVHTVLWRVQSIGRPQMSQGLHIVKDLVSRVVASVKYTGFTHGLMINER
jgi:hypothetical protein